MVRKPLQTEPARSVEQRPPDSYKQTEKNLNSAIQNSTENVQRHLVNVIKINVV